MTGSDKTDLRSTWKLVARESLRHPFRSGAALMGFGVVHFPASIVTGDPFLAGFGVMWCGLGAAHFTQFRRSILNRMQGRGRNGPSPA